MEAMIQSALMENQQSLVVVAIIFATGLMTSLTPCIYPMLPITTSIIANQASHKKQAVFLSITYVLGLALVYAALGILAASTGKLFGSVASHPATLLAVALFCLLMALWILDWLSMPNISFLSSIPKGISSKNSYLNVFVVGCISGLVMAPCTSPVLGMLLMYVAGEGNLLWAALLMFVFAMGMSALLVIAGSFSGFLALLPRSGHWLNVMKWLMALPMVGVAIYLTMQAIA